MNYWRQHTRPLYTHFNCLKLINKHKHTLIVTFVGWSYGCVLSHVQLPHQVNALCHGYTSEYDQKGIQKYIAAKP